MDRFPVDEPDEPRFNFLRPDRRSRVLPVILVLVLLAGAGGVGWYLLRDRTPDTTPTSMPGPTPANTAPEPAATPAPDLPALDSSDTFVRTLVARLSSRPQLVAWLASDRLVQRFVAAVVQIANGVSPRPNLRFLEPGEPFRVRSEDGRVVIDSASFRRYDLVSTTLTSIDPRDAASLYHQLHPLFDRAYAELGIPGSSFDDMMARAIRNLLSVELPVPPIEVVPASTGSGYDFVDPALENSSPAAKQLLRMGPRNAALVQVWLRSIDRSLGLPAPSR
jgi:hypothetical protein